jgi:iron-sulfur cluster repair protein YtfE (RIC family)
MTNLDLTMMGAVHDALRRELAQLARIAARTDDDPRGILRTALGWELFKGYLHIHHTSEDDVLWPTLEGLLRHRPDDLALLEAMESEHAAIDPLLDAIDEALRERDKDPQHLAGLVDALHSNLTGHLRHEEAEALPLIDATLNEQQWQRFGETHRARIGTDVTRFMPWVLHEANEQTIAVVLHRLPPDLLAAYRDDWQPAFANLDLWPRRNS